MTDNAESVSREPTQDPGDHRVWFPLPPETVIEAAEHLINTGDLYSTYLAAELCDGYENAEEDLSDYREPPMEGFYD